MAINSVATALGVISCSNLLAPIIPGATVLNITSSEVHNFSVPAVATFNPTPVVGLDFCNISIALTHSSIVDNADTVYITVWLPLEGWNQRYLATGGGGLAAGIGAPLLAKPLEQGYATSSTDAGVAAIPGVLDPTYAGWVLKNDNGQVNDILGENFLWRSVHDMAIATKDLVKQYYGVWPLYSYWNGCSQAGRQGYASAAKHPYDFDGIMASAPPLESAKLVPSEWWPSVVIQNADEVPPACVLDAYREALLIACDPLDGVVDGLVSDVHRSFETCPFNVSSLVGTEIDCAPQCTVFDDETRKLIPLTPCPDTNTSVIITKSHADTVLKILQGPRTEEGKQLTYSVAPGTSLFALAPTYQTTSGGLITLPFAPAVN